MTAALSSSASTVEVAHARRRFILVGIVVPLVVTALGVALMFAWSPSLPDPIAVHWNAAGHADGFGPVWVPAVLAVVLGAGLAALFGIPVLAASREGEWGSMMRFLGALNAGMSVLLVGVLTRSVGMQRGLDDAHDAPSIVPALVVAAILGTVVGLGAWLVQPDLTTSGGRSAGSVQPGALALAPGEHAVWMRTVTMPRAGMIAVLTATIGFAIAALWLGLTGDPLWGVWAFLAVLFAVLVCTTTVFRVRVSDAGLTVRAPVGIPRWRVPLDEIDSVRVTHVDPITEFGGVGIRLGTEHRFGIVMRRGDALQVTRRGRRAFVVTVDDAATAAALLQALVARAQAAPPAPRG